ncbi:MAG: hydantoinase/oxoprolinase family protein [Candidatus Lokiarchaeota archaeon]
MAKSYSSIIYFPFWEQTLHDIPKMLQKITKNILNSTQNLTLDDIDYIAVTMTAELSDVFKTKKEGVLTILNALRNCFPKEKVKVVNNQGKFLDLDYAFKKYNTISAANWASTAIFLGNYVDCCVMIDAGSTTIDIIPIKNHNPISQGKDDISRLIHHELVYTGGLRATIPSITHFFPFRDIMVRLSFEKFALISDVHLILGNISQEDYINETADNRPTDIEYCYARIARMICLDLNSISLKELNIICNYIYQKQLELIKYEINKFMEELIARDLDFPKKPLFVITGLSANFLVKKVLKDLQYDNIQSFEQLTNIPDNVSSSAFSVAGALYYTLS